MRVGVRSRWGRSARSSLWWGTWRNSRVATVAGAGLPDRAGARPRDVLGSHRGSGSTAATGDVSTRDVDAARAGMAPCCVARTLAGTSTAPAMDDEEPEHRRRVMMLGQVDASPATELAARMVDQVRELIGAHGLGPGAATRRQHQCGRAGDPRPDRQRSRHPARRPFGPTGFPFPPRSPLGPTNPAAPRAAGAGSGAGGSRTGSRSGSR